MSETHETPPLGGSEAEPKATNPWFRLPYLVLFVVVFEVSRLVVYLVTVVQFVLRVVAGHPNGRLRTFGGGLSRYLRAITAYLTYAEDEPPYPFSAWPRE